MTTSKGKVEEFVDELIAPYSVHRKKYERPHGTVARRELKNRMSKKLIWELSEAQRRGFYAGQANAGVSLEECHANYKLWNSPPITDQPNKEHSV